MLTSKRAKKVLGLPVNGAYSIKEVAGAFEVHENTVRRWIDSGWLMAERLGDGTIRITGKEIVRALSESRKRWIEKKRATRRSRGPRPSILSRQTASEPPAEGGK